MPAELLMPRVSPAMQEATVVEWRKKEGDPIRQDEIVVTIESEKASQDVEALTDGVLYKIIARIGDVVPVNKPLAIIRLPQDTLEDLRAYESSSPTDAIAVAPGQPAASNASEKAGGVIKSSPLARKLAESRGIDLAAIAQGSGPGGESLSKTYWLFARPWPPRPRLASPLQSLQISAAAPAGAQDKHIPLSRYASHTINRLRQSKEHHDSRHLGNGNRPDRFGGPVPSS